MHIEPLSYNGRPHCHTKTVHDDVDPQQTIALVVARTVALAVAACATVAVNACMCHQGICQRMELNESCQTAVATAAADQHWMLVMADGA